MCASFPALTLIIETNQVATILWGQISFSLSEFINLFGVAARTGKHRALYLRRRWVQVSQLRALFPVIDWNVNSRPDLNEFSNNLLRPTLVGGEFITHVCFGRLGHTSDALCSRLAL